MTRSIDQAPNPDNNPIPENEPQTSESEAIGLKHETRHSQAIFGEQPRERRFKQLERFDIDNNPREKEKTNNAKKHIAVFGASILSMGGAGVIFAATGNDGPSYTEINSNTTVDSDGNFDAPGINLDENTAVLESPQNINYSEIDVSTLNVDQFYDDSVYPEAYRIKWAHEQLRQRQTPELISDFLAILKSDKRLPDLNFVSIDFNNPKPIEPSLENTGDEILFQQGLDRYTASIETDPNVGRKLIAGVITEEAGTSFDRQLAQVGNTQGEPIDAMYRVSRSDTTLPGQETDVFYETAVADYVPNGKPSKFMKTFNPYDNSFSEIAVQFKENQWVTAYVILEDSSDWIMRPEELAVK